MLNPWNVDALSEIEKESGKKIYTILQLRLHPSIMALKERVANELLANPSRIYDIDLTYLTSRGHWYFVSWKGDERKSGNIASNIGVHFFDMLSWIFGPVVENIVHAKTPDTNTGLLRTKNAKVRWFLSINHDYLPEDVKIAGQRTYRSITVDGQAFEFSEGFTDLHTESYKHILDGRGFGLEDARNSIEIVSTIRNLVPVGLRGDHHPFAVKIKMMDDFFVHESSFIDEDVKIGRGTKVWHFSHILAHVSLGENCVIGQNVSLGPEVKIGDGCKIQNNVSVYKGVELENGVFCGPSMVFTNVLNPRAFIEKTSEFRKTLIRKGATLGANCTIICGVTIGCYALVGAGSVVSKDVPDFALVYGVPGQQHGWVSRAGNRLVFNAEGEAVDTEDDSRYKIFENHVVML